MFSSCYDMLDPLVTYPLSCTRISLFFLSLHCAVIPTCLPHLLICLSHTLSASFSPAFANVFLTHFSLSLSLSLSVLRCIISVSSVSPIFRFCFFSCLIELKVIRYQVVVYMFLLRPGLGHWYVLYRRELYPFLFVTPLVARTARSIR